MDELIDPTPVVEVVDQKVALRAERQAMRMEFADKTKKRQLKRFVDEASGTECERHEYQGPQGSGFIDFEYREKNGKKQMRSRHAGPEARTDTGWLWVDAVESGL